jgi:hypothetical protein
MHIEMSHKKLSRCARAEQGNIVQDISFLKREIQTLICNSVAEAPGEAEAKLDLGWWISQNIASIIVSPSSA